MEWLNYHHLYYFFVAAREGGITAASERLRLSQPTISGQIRALENQLGERLFRRVGRKLVLTETGREVYRYAEEIFGLGRDLMNSVRGRPTGRPARFVVGVADVLPKLISYRLLQPALSTPEPLRIVCREGKPDKLLAELATHDLDLVLADAPMPSSVSIRAFNHLLGECDVTVFGTRALASRHRRGFPQTLDGAPLLLPTDNTVLRRSLDTFFADEGIHPREVGEFEDSALMKSFGQSGAGLFIAPSAIAAETCRQYAVEIVGTIDSVVERFYAISVERRIRHPAVAAIASAAPHMLARGRRRRS